MSSVAAILSGLWAKSSITVTPPAAPSTSSRRLTPVKAPSAAAAVSQVDAQRVRRGDGRQRVGDVVLAGGLQRDRRGLAAAPRGDGEADPARRRRARAGQEVGGRVAEREGGDAAPGRGLRRSAAVSALSRLSTTRLALAAKSANSARSSSIDLWSSEMLFTTATVGE